MTKLITGERIAKNGRFLPGSSALIFDESRERILLTRRSDNGRWCLPGGRMDPGESAAETCIRETKEETGLDIRIVRLIGIYTSPNRMLEYADGNQYQMISFSFEAAVTGGALCLSDETTEVGYFSPSEIESMDVMEHHIERILPRPLRKSTPNRYW